MSPRAIAVADRLDAGLVRGPVEARAEGQVARQGRRPSAAPDPSPSSRRRTASIRRPRPARSPSTARPASQARPSRRSQAIAQSWSASRRTGRPWSSAGDRRAAARGRARGRSRGSRRARRGTAAPAARRPIGRHGIEPAEERPGLRERVRPRRRRVEDRDRVGRQERPARLPAGPGALEDGQPRQVAERLGEVHRGDRVEVRAPLEDDGPDRRRSAGSGTPGRDRGRVAVTRR